ncbi:GNAT family N-acetyltransferase [Lachnospiraceae bacterium OttesenSCG-928-D06]|nr:GNAT family N-acetyltransferase [Lachnospiraceae bacterium OttesenSCG-928-D06]
MNLYYKKASLIDLDELIKSRILVLRAANQLEEDADLILAEAESYMYYRESLANKEHVAYLVYHEGKLVATGGISFYRVMPTYHNPSGRKAYIMNMYTDPKYRRQGIASTVLKLLIKIAKEREVTYITLEATEAGRELYEKNGFVTLNNEMKYMES